MADDVINNMLTSSAVLGLGFGLARSLVGSRRRVVRLEQVCVCVHGIGASRVCVWVGE